MMVIIRAVHGGLIDAAEALLLGVQIDESEVKRSDVMTPDRDANTTIAELLADKRITIWGVEEVKRSTRRQCHTEDEQQYRERIALAAANLVRQSSPQLAIATDGCPGEGTHGGDITTDGAGAIIFEQHGQKTRKLIRFKQGPVRRHSYNCEVETLFAALQELGAMLGSDVRAAPRRVRITIVTDAGSFVDAIRNVGNSNFRYSTIKIAKLLLQLVRSHNIDITIVWNPSHLEETHRLLEEVDVLAHKARRDGDIHITGTDLQDLAKRIAEGGIEPTCKHRPEHALERRFAGTALTVDLYKSIFGERLPPRLARRWNIYCERRELFELGELSDYGSDDEIFYE
jgi:hypothetical protein